jgi:hypothetical protein
MRRWVGPTILHVLGPHQQLRALDPNRIRRPKPRGPVQNQPVGPHRQAVQ